MLDSKLKKIKNFFLKLKLNLNKTNHDIVVESGLFSKLDFDFE